MPNIIFDSRFILSEKTGGISRDSKHFLDSFVKEGWETSLLEYKTTFPRIDVNPALSSSEQAQSHRSEILKSAFLRRSIPASHKHNIFFQSQISPIKINFNGTQIMKVVRVHDLFPISNPEWFTKSANLYFRFALKTLDPGTVLVANSKRTLIQMEEIFGKSLEDFQVNLVSCKSEFTHTHLKCQKCRMCVEPLKFNDYLLAVGTLEPRKNYSRLLDAWQISKMNKDEFKLLIVGRYGWKVKTLVNKMNAMNGVVYLQSTCDYQLKKLYSNMKAFISASLDEGYNLPLDEAVQFRKLCLLSDIKVHRDRIENQSAQWFNPKDVESISDSIDKIDFSSSAESRLKLSNNWNYEFNKLKNDLIHRLNLG